MPKATGLEIKKFYEDDSFDFLTEYGESDSEPYYDIEELNDDEVYYTKNFGTFLDERNGKIISFTKAFIEWRKSQSVDFFVIEIKKEDSEKIISELKEKGVVVKNRG